MKENQNLEWKESWHDEFLKWICGFANAEGGVLLIGRNDKGVDVGVANAKKLLSNHASCPYNPLVANAFFRAGEIEAWGRGIKRIVEACREAGSPAPIITYEPHDLWMEFPYPQDYPTKISKGNAPVMEGRRDETSVKTSVKTSVEILELLRNNPKMTLSEIADHIGKTVRAVEMASSKLVKSGRLRYVGPQKGGHWEVLP